ncbi:MAG: zinc-ribbon domain-containing protein [Candidatus Lokiarchaeota archaeon]|nr:zinc-ribbon domain-containing protein [Candidatus Lokiarchaeota archaeon]
MSIIICRQCGSQNEEGSRFCITCGASLKPTSIEKEIIASRPVLIENISQKSSFLFNTMRSLSEKKVDEKSVSPSQKPVSQDINEQSPITTVQDDKIEKFYISDKIKEKMTIELNNLGKLDRTLEAAAVVDINAADLIISAFSTRASNELLKIIATTIYRINEDSLKSLKAGDIKIMMLQAEDISLILSPITSRLVLILVTNSRSNLGMISFYAEIISQKMNLIMKNE